MFTAVDGLSSVGLGTWNQVQCLRQLMDFHQLGQEGAVFTAFDGISSLKFDKWKQVFYLQQLMGFPHWSGDRRSVYLS